LSGTRLLRSCNAGQEGGGGEEEEEEEEDRNIYGI
jgi:hypothetical protein